MNQILHDEDADVPMSNRKAMTLLFGVFVVAGCGLAYELIMSTAAAYFLGDTVTQFSITIGIFLSSLGLGAAISRRVTRNLLVKFVVIEMAVALIGGLSAAMIYAAYGWTHSTRAVALILPVMVGVLVGLEIPILTRLLAHRGKLKDVLANVLSFDYLGGLLAALIYPLVLLPNAGILRSALVFGTLNAMIALATTLIFRNDSRGVRRLIPVAAGVLAMLIGAYFASSWLVDAVEEQLYQGDIVVAKQTRFQKVVVVQADHGGVDMHLDGHLQFSSLDERRYHESMAHPAMTVNDKRSDVLILGGGDGLLAREILRYPDVDRVALVDIDGELVEISRTEPILTKINEGALSNPRVTTHISDGFIWLREDKRKWDRIFMDLPDPRSEGVARLFSVQFFRIIHNRLKPHGVLVAQSASPYYTPKSFWSAVRTAEAAGLRVQPAHVNVPSFGEWGFVYASKVPMVFDTGPLPDGLAFLNAGQRKAMFSWPGDLQPLDVEASHFDRPVILHYYQEDTERWQ